MSLSGYQSHAQYLADDLLGLLTDDEFAQAAALFDQRGFDLVMLVPRKEAEPLFVFLGKGPTEQAKQLAKLQNQDRLTFWLRARYMALTAADALSIAETAEMNLRGSYRGMLRAIAQAAFPFPRIPSKDDLLGHRTR